MIPILYEHNESLFNTFGIGPLAEASSCEVTEERNGGYELVLKYPTNGRMINEITKERLLRVQVNDNKSIQTFRIYRISVPINGFITVYAQHISYDLSGVVAFPCGFENSNPQQVMNFLSQRRIDRPVPFSFYSDIASTATFRIDQPRTLRSVLGAEKDSLSSIYHGEFLWDNFEVKFLANRGTNNGVTILYGKNLTKLDHNSDLSGVYSHLCPFAKVKEGDTVTYLELHEKKIALTTTLTETKVLIKDFSSYFGSGEGKLQPTEANLRQVATDFILANPNLGIEVPNVTLSFEQLRGQFGYSNLHETVNLCDIVTVKYPSLGIDIQTKIVKIVYDVLKEKFKTLTIGSSKASLVDTTTHTQQEADATSQAVSEIPSYVEQAISHATEQITGANGGCVVIDMDNQSRPYELLVMNDYSKEDATKVWRWNINGLGYSPNGYNGPYTTAITSDGHIVANFIDTGTLTANIIKAGTIQALSGDSYWNLESGDLNLTGAINATSGTFSNVTIGDSCSIYGNLYLEGEFVIYYSATPITYEFETRIGGDAIETSLTKITSSRTYTSKNYITPVGMYTVPNDKTYMDDSIQIGIAEDYSLAPAKLISGLFASRSEYTGQYGGTNVRSSLVLKGDSSVMISYFHDVSFGTDNGETVTWGITGSGLNKLDGKWCIGDEGMSGPLSYVTSKLVDMGHGTYYYGAFYGKWYWGDACYFQMYSSYVDIRGTWKTNGNNWISTSDIKTKNTIEELDDRYSVLFSNLKPRSFKFNEGESGRVHSGFIVQEVLEAMKEAGISSDEYGLCCAFGDKNDPETIWGMRYEELIALCVKEIHRLDKRVKELEEKK